MQGGRRVWASAGVAQRLRHLLRASIIHDSVSALLLVTAAFIETDELSFTGCHLELDVSPEFEPCVHETVLILHLRGYQTFCGA